MRKVKISLFVLVPYAVLWFAFGGVLATGYMLSAVLHEAAHVYVARLLGVDTSRLCVGIYGCKAEMSGLDVCEVGTELPIALAGPIFSLAAAVMLALLSQVLYFWYYPLMNMAVCNLALGTFNLLPFLPLDGGRVLRSLVCASTTRLKGTRFCAIISVVFGSLVLCAFGYYAFYGQYKIFLLIIGIFVIIGSVEEVWRVGRHSVSMLTKSGRPERPKRVRRYAVSCEDDLKGAISYFKDDCFNVVDVLSKEGSVKKTVTEIELRKMLFK